MEDACWPWPTGKAAERPPLLESMGDTGLEAAVLLLGSLVLVARAGGGGILLVGSAGLKIGGVSCGGGKQGGGGAAGALPGGDCENREGLLRTGEGCMRP